MPRTRLRLMRGWIRRTRLHPELGSQGRVNDMSRLFKDLDDCPSSIGAPGLRRRQDLRRALEVDEIVPGQAFLMTGLVTAPERAPRRLESAACGTARPDRLPDPRFPDRPGRAWGAASAEPVIFGTPHTGTPFTQAGALARAEGR